jgi:hypothetical protein
MRQNDKKLRFSPIFEATPLDPGTVLSSSRELLTLTFLLSVKHIKAHPQLYQSISLRSTPPLPFHFISPHLRISSLESTPSSTSPQLVYLISSVFIPPFLIVKGLDTDPSNSGSGLDPWHGNTTQQCCGSVGFENFLGLLDPESGIVFPDLVLDPF